MTPTLTPTEIAEIAARADAATPGEWCVDGFHTSAVIVLQPDPARTWMRVAECDSDHFKNPNWYCDAAFIAASRSDVPRLLAHISALQAEKERAEKDADYARCWANTSVDSVKAVMWRYEDALKEIETGAPDEFENPPAGGQSSADDEYDRGTANALFWCAKIARAALEQPK